MQTLRNQLLVLLIVTATLCSGCFKSQNVVTKIPPANGKLVKLDGVPYALPRTVVKVALPFKKVDKSPGEFEAYTPCFFSPEVAAGRVRKEESVFSLNPPTFGSRGEPDPDERYIAKIKGGYFENKTMLLEFNGDGVITKGDVSSENVAIDVAIKGAKAVLSLVAKGITPAGIASPGEGFRTVDEKTKVEKALIDICRSRVVAEAAQFAAARADKAATVSGNPAARAAADYALLKSNELDKKIAAQEKAFTEVLRKFDDTRVAGATLTAALDKAIAPALITRNRSLIDDVICDAKDVMMSLEQAVAAAGQNTPDEAKAIVDAIMFVGKNPANLALQCDTLPEVDLQLEAFSNGFTKAKEIYDHIVELKKKQEDLSSGQSAPQGMSADGLKLLLDQSDRTISTYQSIFFGTKDTQTWTGNFEFTPGKSVVSNSYNTFQTSPVLLVFTKSDGICETAESKRQGVRINPDFVAAKCPLPATAQSAWLSVSRIMSDDSYLGHMAAANKRDERKGERGFYYRIPARTIVKLEQGQISAANELVLYAQSDQGRTWRTGGLEEAAPAGVLYIPAGNEVGRDTMRVAQLGVTASIPASAAGRKTQYTIDFDESTGALKNFKLASNALLEKSLVDDAASAANDILAAKQARDKAKAEANDPLAQKKRELELLKTDNAIDEEKKKKANPQQP